MFFISSLQNKSSRLPTYSSILDKDFEFDENSDSNNNSMSHGKRSRSPIPLLYPEEEDNRQTINNQKKESLISPFSWNITSSNKRRKEKKSPFPGISNLGNTCFMAATIQVGLFLYNFYMIS